MDDQELQTFNDTVENLEDNLLNSSLIKDNKLIFPIGTKLFRVRMPNQFEQSKAEEYRNEKTLNLISSGKCTTKKALIKMLKDSGVIDIEDLEEQKKKVTKQLETIWINLAVRFSTEVKSIEKFKEQEGKLKLQLKKLSLEISLHLIPSLETQQEKAYMECITSMCTDKCIGNDEWIENWETFEDYQKADPIITDSAITYMTWLLLNSRG